MKVGMDESTYGGSLLVPYSRIGLADFTSYRCTVRVSGSIQHFSSSISLADFHYHVPCERPILEDKKRKKKTLREEDEMETTHP